jgi:hypothetical protein
METRCTNPLREWRSGAASLRSRGIADPYTPDQPMHFRSGACATGHPQSRFRTVRLRRSFSRLRIKRRAGAHSAAAGSAFATRDSIASISDLRFKESRLPSHGDRVRDTFNAYPDPASPESKFTTT